MGRPRHYLEMWVVALTSLSAAWLLGCMPSIGTPAPAEPSGPTTRPAAARAAAKSASDDDSGAVAGQDGRLDVNVRDMEIPLVLELLSRQAKTNIVASTSVKGQVSANLYHVTLEQALSAILLPNKFGFAKIDGAIFVGTSDDIAALMPPPATEVFPLLYVEPAEAAAAVRAALGENAHVATGGAGGEGGASSGGGSAASGGSSGGGSRSFNMSSASGSYIIVSAPPERMDLVREILRKVDRRPGQVLIEATVLRATLNESNALGIDFVALGGLDFQGVDAVSNAAADVRTGQVPAPKYEQTLMNINTNFNANLPGGGFTFGLIKNNLGNFIRALEEVTDVVVVANPKIVALNRQEGEVIVGRRDGYITTTVTETAAIQKVEFLETGTQIRFRPVINNDGTVRLVVHPKDSNGGLTAANLPFEETTEAHADVLVEDGQTVLIGGLFRERTTTSRSQVPLVGDIPGLGLLAGNKVDDTTREEVVILLTVHILKQDEAERAVVRELLDDVERVRIGIRQGVLGLGRERLGQAHYHAALRQLEHGERDLALFNIRMALHNQPKHIGALKLYEQLENKRLWDDDGSRMRTFVWDLIRPGPGAGRAASPPMFGRPAPVVPDPGPNAGPQEPAP